jgi:hypothetical protein
MEPVFIVVFIVVAGTASWTVARCFAAFTRKVVGGRWSNPVLQAKGEMFLKARS